MYHVKFWAIRVATSLKKPLKSLNLMPILEILERSLNLPRILEFPWKVLEFWETSLKSLNFALSVIHHALISRIGAATRHFLCVLASLKMTNRSLNYPWILPIEFRGNPVTVVGKLRASKGWEIIDSGSIAIVNKCDLSRGRKDRIYFLLVF